MDAVPRDTEVENSTFPTSVYLSYCRKMEKVGDTHRKVFGCLVFISRYCCAKVMVLLFSTLVAILFCGFADAN